MNKTVLGAVILLAGFLTGAWYGTPKPTTTDASTSAPRVLRYACPMHPQYTSDKPGAAPCCGMRLEPVYATADSRAVEVKGEHRGRIGVRVGHAELSAGNTSLRLLGRVAPDEARVYRVSASTDGLVREIAPPVAGSIVRKGDLLAKLFTRDILTSQQGYVYALATRDRMRREARNSSSEGDAAAVQVYTAEQNLAAAGLSEEQIAELRKTRTAQSLLEVRAPIGGVILVRNLTLGVRTDRTVELYRIADLSRVWVLADVYGRDAGLVRRGVTARVRCDGRTLPARVADALPQFDAQSRTLKVRLELDNPDYALRPDMFVEVELPVRMQPQVTVPADAVIDTGLRRLVYVEAADGSFHPREVETGWRTGDRIAVTSGLNEGEKIVVAGTFLIDSESRLRAR